MAYRMVNTVKGRQKVQKAHILPNLLDQLLEESIIKLQALIILVVMAIDVV